MQLSSMLGKKTRQSQGFLQDGTRVPLSGVVVTGNFITQIKTQDKEGYNALQIGIDTKKKANRAIFNHIKKAGLSETPRFFREIRVDDTEGFQAGLEIKASEVFQPGDTVDVTGVSKGKGWAGVVKRYHFKGGPRTHGQSDRERAPGSIGQTTTPGRVYKGKRMAGRMGSDTVTVKNLTVIEVTNDGVLLIKGLVPGSLNSYVIIKKVGVNKKFVPLYREVEEIEEEQVVSKQEAQAPVEAEVTVESAQPVSETLTPEDVNVSDNKEGIKAEEKVEGVVTGPKILPSEPKEDK